MERHSSFENLKKRANSSSSNNRISITNENKIISFIDLLKTSAIVLNNSKDKETITNSLRDGR